MVNWDALQRLEDKAQRELAEYERHKGTVYLPHTDFGPDSEYAVEIDGLGVTVYSECCSDRMSVDTARKVHEALGRYLDAQSA